MSNYGDIPPLKTDIRKCCLCGERQEIQFMQWSQVLEGWMCSACKPQGVIV